MNADALFIDIETSPNKVWAFDLKNAYIAHNQIIDPTRMLCYAAKWYGTEGTMFYSEWGPGGKEQMLDTLWALLDAAEVVVHYNGIKFDEPKINGEFWQAGMLPPSPFQRIDLWRTVSQLGLPSSKLVYATNAINLPTKIETGGFDLWARVMEGDPDARILFEAYNRNDVEIMVPLYESLRPWIKGHPNMALHSNDACCVSCNSTNYQKRGYSYKLTGAYQRYWCKDCGTWFTDTHRAFGVDIRREAS